MNIVKMGVRVQMMYCPENIGTVSGLRPDGGFRVTFDFEDRKRGQPRSRWWYRKSQCHLFVPEGSAQIRVADGDDIEGIDFPEALLKAYGIAYRSG